MATTLLVKIRCAAIMFTFFIMISSCFARPDTYIIHMDLSSMPKVYTDHHNWYLNTISSISDASTSSTLTTKHVYTYTSAVHGFSATLTNTELQALKKSSGFISCTRDRPLEVHTTHTPHFLGLSSVSGLWQAPNQGEDAIIGLVDTGISPESGSFSDEGMSQVPSRWKGKCEPGTEFRSSLCNKKLIGARFYNKGLLANNPGLKISVNSTRDVEGHGTHTSSTAAGNYVKGASYFGYANGTARGMAPKARIAMYKAIWSGGVYSSDVIAAIDQAIQDGVDVLSLSLALRIDDIFLEEDTIAVATFAAMENGILVAASAGNDGPASWSLINGAPWMVTVGAGTIDRDFQGVLTLGNRNTIPFTSLFPGNVSQRQSPLAFLDKCDSVQELKKMKHLIVVCKDHLSISDQVENAEFAGVFGAVFIINFTASEFYTRSSFPAAFVGLRDGQTVIDYATKSKDPVGTFQFRKTVTGIKPAPKVDVYSSRGPFPSCHHILKPDLLAPGSQVLGSWSPISSVTKVRSHPVYTKFNLMSGTSMATPHAAGVAALIKTAHPNWSPAAIRSALMTTATSLDNTQSVIKDPTSYDMPATPLDIGSGHINPTRALEPGLIYDATAQDYINLLCAMNYTKKQIQIITGSSRNCIPNSRLDLNYPSFIAYFNGEDDSSNTTIEFRRSLTNVGEAMSVYYAKLTEINGVKAYVEPQKLVFKEKYEKLSYKLVLEGPKILNQVVVHGSLSWLHSDGKYVVRSPIVATSLVVESPDVTR